MKNRRDLFILIALFAALIIFTMLGPARSSEENQANVPTTHSSGPGGALALLRWTETMGYDAHRLEYRDFLVDEGDAALIMLNPTEPMNRTQTDLVLQWVNDGGVLILANDFPWLFGGNAILDELHIAVEGYSETLEEIERAPVVQPVVTMPALNDVLVKTAYVLRIRRDDVIDIVGVPEAQHKPQQQDSTNNNNPPADEATTLRSVVAGLHYGQGYIYISSAAYPFTNEGLREPNNAALMINLLRRVPAGGRIQFDEWHHGFFQPPSLRSVMLSSPWGQAVLYALAVTALYLVATGRRFGQPIPLMEEVARRSSTEYIESMADMYQRGKQRGFILRHYATSFKRRLARHYALNPHQDDAAFVDELARYQEQDQAHLLALLQRLRHEQPGEDEMLRLVNESDTIASQQ